MCFQLEVRKKVKDVNKKYKLKYSIFACFNKINSYFYDEKKR